MPVLTGNGTQTAVINTEHTLSNPTGSKWYSGYIDLTNMASGDNTEIRVYVLVKTAGSYIQYYLVLIQIHSLLIHLSIFLLFLQT